VSVYKCVRVHRRTQPNLVAFYVRVCLCMYASMYVYIRCCLLSLQLAYGTEVLLDVAPFMSTVIIYMPRTICMPRDMARICKN